MRAELDEKIERKISNLSNADATIESPTLTSPTLRSPTLMSPVKSNDSFRRLPVPPVSKNNSKTIQYTASVNPIY